MPYLGPAGPYIPVDPTKTVQDSPAHLRYRQEALAKMKAQEAQREHMGEEMERKARTCQPFNAPAVRQAWRSIRCWPSISAVRTYKQKTGADF